MIFCVQARARLDSLRLGQEGILYVFEDFVLDTDKRELRRGANVVSVAPQVFDVLDYLIRNRERVVSKDDLVTAIWEGRIVSDAALTTRLKAVRSAIGDSGEGQRLIKTLPRKGFRFVGRVNEEQGPGRTLDGGTSVEPPRPTLALPDKPSIAVLPFTNMSGDPDQEHLSDGITEDIITELSRFSELFVIARNSSFQYKGKSPDIRQVSTLRLMRVTGCGRARSSSPSGGSLALGSADSPRVDVMAASPARQRRYARCARRAGAPCRAAIRRQQIAGRRCRWCRAPGS
jgi:DNA-binding winged helix-turn-helix (wHTH) protein